MAFVNGVGYDFASLQFSIYGNPLVAGIVSIDLTTGRSKSNNLGAQSKPVERTRGGETYGGSITLHMKEVLLIKEAANNIALWKIPAAPAVLIFYNESDPIKTCTIPMLEFTEESFSTNTGDEEITVPLPFICAEPIWD